MSESEQIRTELHAMMRRYAQESDITFVQMLGILELVKFDLIKIAENKPE